MDRKIALITLHYNESKIIPFVVDYWSKFVTHAYIFDNGSTDNSLELLSQYDWISVIDYSHLTGNKLDDIANMNIKNNFWKMIRDYYDWIVVCDFDECLYCENWDFVLDYFEKSNVDCLAPWYYNMICEKFPEYVYNSLFHYDNKYISNITDEDMMSRYIKLMLFDTRNMYELNLAPGSHSSSPLILIQDYYDSIKKIKSANFVRTPDIQCYHLCDIGLDYVLEKRRHNRESRMTEKQLENNFAVHYTLQDEEIINNFNEQWKNKQTL